MATLQIPQEAPALTRPVADPNPWSGVYVPLVTPFSAREVNEAVLRELIDYLIAEGVSGLVPCGTTGESATLAHEEHRRVIELTVEHAAGRVPVMAGTGSNNTAEALEMTRHAEAAGADAALAICPYYNRPNQAGLIEHFRRLAGSTSLPLLIYNIPKRTGVNMEAATVAELARIPNIVGIKEASGDINQIMDIIRLTDEGFSVLSGDDHLLYSIMLLGGQGGIAAAAHIAPRMWGRLVELVDAGDIPAARELHYRLLPLVRVLFLEPNPAPVKAALDMLGLDVGDPRLPLLPATDSCRKAIRQQLTGLGLLAGVS